MNTINKQLNRVEYVAIQYFFFIPLLMVSYQINTIPTNINTLIGINNVQKSHECFDVSADISVGDIAITKIVNIIYHKTLIIIL